MAKRRKTTVRTVAIQPYRPQAPIIRVQAPRASPKKHRHHRRRSGSTLSQSTIQSNAIGGFLYGVIEKNFGAQLPTLPLIGRAGSIALAAYFFGGNRGGIIADVGKAAAVIAGYQFGTTGKVSGLIPPQVQGLAAQV